MYFFMMSSLIGCDYFSPTKAGKHFLIETDDTAEGKKSDYAENLQDGDEDERMPGKSKV